ncbi:Na+/H+ antiporter NhaC [Aminirod propionatiphilus]|uniref:Na+/H+ antiporter NhaC n=1 Tax=Aminirod propionatiphilus TaxID=3415223 RepID=A0ACD1DUQ7_9BACT|nr:Na+/H+ antiporter NhaC [Synergistota bacterium]
MEHSQGRKPGMALALVTFAGISAIIGYGLLGLGLDAHVPIALAAIFAGLVGRIVLGVKWKEMEEAVFSTISSSLGALLILIAIGMLVGSWVHAGVVPGMIYYGFNILSPGIFLLATLLLCAIVSLATGSSWGVGGTVGVALIGIAMGLGIPAPLAAGVIISGAYFGDKMSPLSDTTNIAPAVAGSNLFDHIRAMVWTTLPTLIIVAVITVVLGVKYAGNASDFDSSRILAMQSMLGAEFPISPLCAIPPLLVLVLAIMKFPALPSMMAGTFAASLMSLVNGHSLPEVLSAIHYGYSPTVTAEFAEAGDGVAALLAQHGLSMASETATEVGELLSGLLARGGIDSMMWSLSLITIALVLGGVMERCGYLEAMLTPLLLKVRKVGGLVSLVMVSSFISNVFLGDQYLAIVVPGRMFNSAVGRSGLSPRMLSRTLEDCGTMTAVLVPWTGCGAFQSSALGVPTLEYLPYCFLNILNPIVAAVLTYLGIGIYWGKDGEDKVEKRTDINFDFLRHDDEETSAATVQ